jgi:hypothetical protein
MTVVTPYDTRGKICPVCGKRFRSSLALALHLEKEHPGIFVEQDES